MKHIIISLPHKTHMNIINDKPKSSFIQGKNENRGTVLVLCFIVHLQLAGQIKLLKMLFSLGFSFLLSGGSSKGLEFDNN